MEIIRVATWIDAPVERCFLLSLSIDLHVASARMTRKRAKGGVTAGLIGEGQTVTFRGRPFGVLGHTSRIDELRPYSYFRDVMIAGPFRHFVHEHHFAAMDDGTRVRDEVRFSSRWGPLGRILARKRLKAFLMERGAEIKRVAESEQWRLYLDNENETENRIGPTSVKGVPVARRNRNVLLRSGQQIAVPRQPHA
jgi:ligand-binding SRPBCC domain-containing protein